MDEIQTMPNGEKELRYLVLDNKMKVLLISKYNDKIMNLGEKPAAAAVSVNIGSNQDPSSAPGMAHFLEHMLFNGSKKYPKPFAELCVKAGGIYKANTYSDKTVYKFECDQNKFSTLFDMFADFFISPLFDKKSMDNEILRIDNEFQSKLGDFHVELKRIIQTMSITGNPIGKFADGNMLSLKTEPKAAKVDIYKLLQNFYNIYYSSHLMTLVVNCYDSLENMEKIVRNSFNSVRLNESERNAININEYIPAIDLEKFHRYYYILNSGILLICWCIPSIRDSYRYLPEKILPLLLGDFGEGSPCKLLIEMDLITELYLHIDNDSPFCTFIYYHIFLTNNGRKEIPQICELIFSYLNVLKQGFTEEFTNFLLKLNDMTINSESKLKSDCATYVAEIAMKMHTYRIEDLFLGNKLILDFDEQGILDIINLLEPSNVCIMEGTNLVSKTNYTTKYYSYSFGFRDFNKEELDGMVSPRHHEGLYFPKENPLVPLTFQKISPNLITNIPPEDIVAGNPYLSPYGKLFYLPNRSDHRTNILLLFTGTCLRKSVEEMALYKLWEIAIGSNLFMIKKYAENLNMSLEIEDSGDALSIELKGFSDSMYYFTYLVITGINELELTPGEYDKFRKKLKYDLISKLGDDELLANTISKKLKMTCYYTFFELIEALEYITYDSFVDFTKTMFKDLSLDAFIYGNYNPRCSVELFERIVTCLGLSPNGKSGRPTMRFFKKKVTIIRTPSYRTNTRSTYVQIEYIIGPFNDAEKCVIYFLDDLLVNVASSFLREKEQLGYRVNSRFVINSEIGSCVICVWSDADKNTVYHCSQKMEYMYTTIFLQELEKITDEDFDIYKDNFIRRYESSFQNSNGYEVAKRAILCKDYKFENQKIVVQMAKWLKRKNLITFFKNRFLKSENVRELIIEIDSFDRSKKRSRTDKLELEYISVDSIGQIPDTIQKVLYASPYYPQL